MTRFCEQIIELHLVDFVQTLTSLFSSNGIIPTAALLLGVNAPDHSDFFGLLAKDLRESVTPHVAVLRSEIAKSTLR